MSTKITNEVAAFIAEHILGQPGRSIDPEEKLITSGLIDSLSLVDIALFVEEHYRVVIDDTELNADAFDSLNELTNLIKSRQHE